LAGKRFSREAIADLCARARRDVEAGLEWGGVEGCALAVAFEGEIVRTEGFGAARADTPMQIMSPTKTILEAALWILRQRGRIRPDDFASCHVPEFGTNGKERITLAMLETHTSAIPWQKIDFPQWADRAERLKAFAQWKPEGDPGSYYEYHPATASWVLAEVIERAGGRDYRAFVKDEVLAPLGLGTVETLSLGEPVSAQQRTLLARNHIPGYAPDAARRPRMPGGFDTQEGLAVGMPGAGAVGTAAGLALLYQHFLHNRARLWDDALLDEVRYRTRIAMPDNLGRPMLRTLSFVQAGPVSGRYGERIFFGARTSEKAFGHQGLGGQVVWADPETGLSFAYLTNTIVFPPGGSYHPRAFELSMLAAALADPD
jgi:CubicO group peptidase (beta-lactamase class C family)